MLDVVGEHYIQTARAKGVSELRVIFGHALRNALLPVITVVGADFGSFLTGAVLTESIFAWPGIGRFTLDAILKRDVPTIQGAVFFMAVVFMVINLLVDLAYAWADPRIRLRRESAGGGSGETMIGKILRQKNGLVGFVIAGLVFAVALLAPAISPYDPYQIDMAESLRPPSSRASAWDRCLRSGRDEPSHDGREDIARGERAFEDHLDPHRRRSWVSSRGTSAGVSTA